MVPDRAAILVPRFQQKFNPSGRMGLFAVYLTLQAPNSGFSATRKEDVTTKPCGRTCVCLDRVLHTGIFMVEIIHFFLCLRQHVSTALLFKI
jgi:hypothetical protein